MGLEQDRIVHILRKFPANRVYFLRNSSKPPKHDEEEKKVLELQKIFEKLVPLAERFSLTANYMDFEEIFLQLLEIMKKERMMGNEVIVNISAGSRIAALAAWIAASIVSCKIYYVHAKQYSPPGELLISKGVVGDVQIMPFPVILPEMLEQTVLIFLSKHNNTVNFKLEDLVKQIGIENIENTKTIQSAIVKMSYCIRSLKDKGYMTSKKTSHRRQQISLTDSGSLMARTMMILNLLGAEAKV